VQEALLRVHQALDGGERIASLPAVILGDRHPVVVRADVIRGVPIFSVDVMLVPLPATRVGSAALCTQP
jgi:hypothetical protein